MEMGQSQSKTAEPHVKIRASFWVDRTHQIGPDPSYGHGVCALHDNSTPTKSSTNLYGSNSSPACPVTSASPSLRPDWTSEALVDDRAIFQTKSVITSGCPSTDINCPPSPTALALSESSGYTIDTNVLLQKAADLRNTTTRPTSTRTSTASTAQEPTPPPSPPPLPTKSSPPWVSSPSFPPNDYSQPPKEQTYDRFMIGGRRQPVHSSQKLESEHPLSPTAPAIPRPRASQPTVRFASGSTPPAPPSPVSANSYMGSLNSAQRSRTQRFSRSVPQDEAVNELQALWNKKGIKRETEEDEDDGVSASISPSESVSQIGGGKAGSYKGY